MNDMLDAGTEKYFDEKFKNLDDKLVFVVTSVEKIDGTVIDHGHRLVIVESKNKEQDKFQTEHMELHKTIDNKKQFNFGQWIAVSLVILAILADKFL